MILPLDTHASRERSGALPGPGHLPGARRNRPVFSVNETHADQRRISQTKIMPRSTNIANEKRSRGRPRTAGTSHAAVTVAVRLPLEAISDIDVWGRLHADRLDRSAAIRRLIAFGLQRVDARVDQERFQATVLALEARNDEVARLRDRLAQEEARRREAEVHRDHAIKDLIVLRTACERPRSRAPRRRENRVAG